jgi:hypothetical protein
MATGKALNGKSNVKLAVCAAVSTAGVVAAYAAQPIRAMHVDVEKSGGAVSSFNLTFDTTPTSTALYACWDEVDRGSSTNGWAHVEKIGDIAGDETSLVVPISRFPTWGKTDCLALRFVMEPGALFERAGTYLGTKSDGNQYIDTGYMLDKTDAIDISWTFTHISSQSASIVCGSVAYSSGNTYADQYFIRYGGSGNVACKISNRNGTVEQKTNAGASYTFSPQSLLDSNTRVRVAISATEQSIWTNSVTSTGFPSGDEVLLVHNTREFVSSFTQQTNCFLFSWPGYKSGTWPEAGKFIKGKMYHCDIVRSGVPAVSLLPVEKDSEVCFYDTVRKVFLRNIGTGSLALSAASVDVGVATDPIFCEIRQGLLISIQ